MENLQTREVSPSWKTSQRQSHSNSKEISSHVNGILEPIDLPHVHWNEEEEHLYATKARYKSWVAPYYIILILYIYQTPLLKK